jgi:hypothetical protein
LSKNLKTELSTEGEQLLNKLHLQKVSTYVSYSVSRILDIMINVIAFSQLNQCPSSLSIPLKALWYDLQGDWNQAHILVQDESDTESAWVHAYLHRKEGDIPNARYWYKRSQQLEFSGSLKQEWEHIARNLLLSTDELNVSKR